MNYLLILTVSILVNWAVASYLLSTKNTKTWSRRVPLYLGQTFNIGLLAWFKYSFYFAFLYGDSTEMSVGLAAIPIGISFYTFQQAVFLQEAYYHDADIIDYIGKSQGFVDRMRAFVRYVAFVIFFPQLVIGPIVYLTEFAPQAARKTFGIIKSSNIEIGTFILLVGLFKKVVIADNLGTIVDPVFEQAANGGDISALVAWTATLGYYAQLYFDFSGYSDVAVGASRLFGITLPINFDSPLKAVSISDFYKRWHITLTRVISRFLYTPLSIFGMRQPAKSGSFTYHALVIWVPLLVNFMAIALWHGAATTFMLFGFIHAIWYITEVEVMRTNLWKQWKKRTSKGLRAALGRAFFIVPMVLCFSLFRSTSIEAWTNMTAGMFDISFAVPRVIDFVNLCAALGALGFCLLLPNVYELTKSYEPGIKTYQNQTVATILPGLHWKPNLTWGLVTAGTLLTIIYYMGRLPPFLYLGF